MTRAFVAVPLLVACAARREPMASGAPSHAREATVCLNADGPGGLAPYELIELILGPGSIAAADTVRFANFAITPGSTPSSRCIP